MPFLYDAQGVIVTADHKGVQLPVFINGKGEQSPFDADATIATIASLNRESQGHREAKETATSELKKYTGIADPEAARKALEIVGNLDAKKLVDSGEIERVKNEIKAAFQAQLDERTRENQTLQEEIYTEKIGGAFTRSKIIGEKLAIPADFVQARFGSHFGIENGSVYAVDSSGNKIYSRVNPGVPADFDEALMILVDQYPQKDSILKGTNGSGSGANGYTNGNGNGAARQSKGDIGGSRGERAQAIQSRFPDLGTSASEADLS